MVARTCLQALSLASTTARQHINEEAELLS
jgi:hypothetical protein